MKYIEINKAIKDINKTVALETTIISHGLPYPQNLEIALELENIIKGNGCYPATIGLINGKIKIGLTKDEIKKFAVSENVVKASERDISKVISEKKLGALTVAGTIKCCHLVNIDVFATGGIGGVHKEVLETGDVSADLYSLAKHPVIVVSAGAKAILDLQKTVELLETLSVPVIGFKTGEFPSFYSRSSNIKIEKASSVSEITRRFKIRKNLNDKGGILVANPIPQEFELNKKYVDNLIKIALNDMKKKGIKGKGVTPYLLNYLNTNSENKTIEANLELVKNNVKVACEIAKNN